MKTSAAIDDDKVAEKKVQ